MARIVILGAGVSGHTAALHARRHLGSEHDVVVVSPLPISLAHIDRMRTLPYHHRDPFDRLIIAQAMEEGLTIVTRDRRFPAYGVPLLMA